MLPAIDAASIITDAALESDGLPVTKATVAERNSKVPMPFWENQPYLIHQILREGISQQEYGPLFAFLLCTCIKADNVETVKP